MMLKSLGGTPDFLTHPSTLVWYALAMSAKTGERITFRSELDLDRVFDTERECHNKTQN